MFVQDLWPQVDVPMVFGGDETDRPQLPQLKQSDSLKSIKSELRIRSSKSHESQKSLKGNWTIENQFRPQPAAWIIFVSRQYKDLTARKKTVLYTS